VLRFKFTTLLTFQIPTSDKKKIEYLNRCLDEIRSVVDKKYFQKYWWDSDYQKPIRAMLEDLGEAETNLKHLYYYRFTEDGRLDMSAYHNKHLGLLMLLWLVSYYSDNNQYTFVKHFDYEANSEIWIVGKARSGKQICSKIKQIYKLPSELLQESKISEMVNLLNKE